MTANTVRFGTEPGSRIQEFQAAGLALLLSRKVLNYVQPRATVRQSGSAVRVLCL